MGQVQWPTTVMAKELTSWQKENFRAKRNLTAKRKTLQQKEDLGKKNDSRQNFFNAKKTF